MNTLRAMWVLTFLAWPVPGAAQSLLVPMDRVQENHLKAYGLTYWALEQYGEAEWLLNYRGGSFLLPDMQGLRRQAALRGITIEAVSGADIAGIRAVIADSNMETVILEKAPKVAIYTPPNSTPWDDPVTMALEYAQIPYETIWDDDVVRGNLGEYEWL
ncbi:MAG: asparagine synthetase B, partial [Gemmatimonadetes bacterium]|nr:asparagine synthetase B [Gemmatimonadota bacterium]